MKTLRTNQTSLLFVGVISSLLIVACTKEVPYKYEVKQDVLAKSAVDTESDYVMSSSVMNVSRSSEEALPYSSSDNKRIKMVWTENSLRLMETERDLRFSANKANDKLVLEIPVEHVQYECAKDKYGQCTNEETQNNEIAWQNRGSFKVKFESAKSGDVALLPLLISKTLGDNCYNEVSSRLVGYKIETDALNFQIERTFVTDINCLGQIDSLSDATVTAVYHYSVVKAASVLSPNFKTVEYPDKDENTFGFFSTQQVKLDTDNNKSEKSIKKIMNHWNPERTVIDYHLSDEFAKPENKVIKDLTFSTVASINDGLAKSGAKFKINLHEPSGKVPGDIRNSMIVLVEDPVASSVIGYGPQTEDPLTGEIISARTVMFLGTIKKFIKYTYDDIVRMKKSESMKAQDNVINVAAELTAQAEQARFNLTSISNLGSGQPQKQPQKAVAKLDQDTSISPAVKNGSVKASIPLDKIKAEVKAYTRNTNDEFVSGDPKAQFKYLREAKNCAFAMGNEGSLGTISNRLSSKFSADAKPWEQLSEEEKENAIAIILPEIWVPTLIHELGHNLGLRHNFQGSEDKANYYSPEELANLGVDHSTPASSVMDYVDDLRALPVLGKYDIAALRFAYAKKVETKDGSIVEVKSTLSDLATQGNVELKEFGYCTDEHTGVNAGCRRFDLGSSYTEIAKHEIEIYLNSYSARNFRNGAANFSLFDDVSYGQRTYGRFMGLRTMQEVYERIKFRFNLEDDNQVWDQNEFLKDIKTASQLSGQFLMSVLATPDTTCLVARANKPDTVVAILPLDSVDATQLSCFDLELNANFVVIGQTGKSFNSKKSPTSTNSYADQIDVRGVWIDKLMAARVLFKRQLSNSSFDKNGDNYMDRQDMADLLGGLTESMILNKVAGPQEVTLKDGSKVILNLPVDLSSTHVIQKPIHPAIASALGAPNRDTHFTELLIGQVVANMTAGLKYQVSGKPLSDAVRVKKVSTLANLILDGVSFIDIGDERYIASPENKIAMEAIESLKIVTVLEKLSSETLINILKAKFADPEAKPSAEVKDANELAAWSMDLDTLFTFFQGGFDSSDSYKSLLMLLQ